VRAAIRCSQLPRHPRRARPPHSRTGSAIQGRLHRLRFNPAFAEECFGRTGRHGAVRRRHQQHQPDGSELVEQRWKHLFRRPVEVPANSSVTSITVTATSAAQSSVQASTGVTVTNGGGGTSTAFAIGTSSIPPAVESSPYSTSLLATGGEPPYQWKIVSGSLPAGFSFRPAQERFPERRRKLARSPL